MSDRPDEISQIRKTDSHSNRYSLRTNRFMRLIVAGVINSLFSLTLFSWFMWLGMETKLSLLAALISGTLFNFLTTGGYVFRQLSPALFPRFLICYFFVYGINLALLEVLALGLSNKIVAQAILTLPIGLLSYFLMARFVFIKINN
jgi:putative flippase GtrA